jgi:hypothetical protein
VQVVDKGPANLRSSEALGARRHRQSPSGKEAWRQSSASRKGEQRSPRNVHSITSALAPAWSEAGQLAGLDANFKRSRDRLRPEAAAELNRRA